MPAPTRRLLALVTLTIRPSLRSHVAGALWPEACEGRASGNLRSALWRLGRLKHRLVEVSGEHLQLASDVAVDLRESTAMAHRVLDGSADLDEAEAIVAALSSPLLPAWSEDWVVTERGRFCQLRLHALESLCEQLAAAGRFAEAVGAGLAAVEGDPLRESAHRALIRAHLAEGNEGAALQQYREFRRLLLGDLGLEPSPEMEALATGLTLPAAG